MNTSKESFNSAFKETELSLGDRQYLAGAFDAGISIWISKGSQSLRVRVGRKDRGCLEAFSPFFPLGAQEAKHQWYMGMAGEDARPLLEAVRFDVRLKKPLVELAIEYLDWKKKSRYTTREERIAREENLVKRMEDIHEAKNTYLYDIGEAPISLEYLAGFLDQQGTVDPTTNRISIGARNKSFMQHLKQEFGGYTYPKDAENPNKWKIMGTNAEKLWNDLRVFMKIMPQRMEDFAWKHSQSRRERK